MDNEEINKMAEDIKESDSSRVGPYSEQHL